MFKSLRHTLDAARLPDRLAGALVTMRWGRRDWKTMVKHCAKECDAQPRSTADPKTSKRKRRNKKKKKKKKSKSKKSKNNK